MKGFNEILGRVADALGTTINKTVELYPQLRAEYGWYYGLSNLQLFTRVVLAITAVIMVFTVPFIHMENEKQAFKVGKIFVITLIVLAMLWLLATILLGIMSPDILIIKEILDK